MADTNTPDLPDPIEADVPETPTPPPRKKSAYKVVNFIEAKRLTMDISYSLVDLSGAMMEQSSLYVHYAMLAAKAAKQVDDFELMIDAARSKIDRLMRNKMAEEGAKITEPLVERAISLHPNMIALRRALNEARQVEAVSKGAVKGFEQRRDMLIQHGATERKERDGEVRTMSRPTPSDEARRVHERASAIGKINQH